MGELAVSNERREFREWLVEHRVFLDPKITESDAYLCWIAGYAAAMKWADSRIAQRLASSKS